METPTGQGGCSSGAGCHGSSAPNGPEDFGFPHKPYALQLGLMGRVYETLESGGAAILESPTGTGKTLSLLCPTIAWMKRHEQSLLAEALLPGAEDEACEEWAREHRRTAARAAAGAIWRRRGDRRETRRQRLQRAHLLTSNGTVHKEKVRRLGGGLPGPAGSQLKTPEAEFSLETPPVLPMPEVLEATESQAAAEEEAFDSKLQIVFCSRTHSQLSQVLHEIKQIPAADGLAIITLGARTNLCVNDSVRSRARGGAHLNDLCKVATANTKAVGGCGLKKQAHTMADACLTEPMDIEALVQRGRAPVGGGCPYHGTRQAVREADVILVPYASLVNNDTRRKLGIRTEGNVFIFDEAHNLLEAISDSNSVTVTAAQARSAVDDLDAYAARYEARLKAENAMHLRQFRQFCAQLHQHVASLEKSSAHTVGAFLVALAADHFDLPELSRFLEATELPRKVRGYADAHQVGVSRSAPSGSVYAVAGLLAALRDSTASDRILCQMPAAEGESASMRYLSLDAEARFRDLVSTTRAVIFAGGTLEPRMEFAPLLAGVGGAKAIAAPRINHFSGRHVVPSAHIFARYVTHGPAGHALDFRKDMRAKPAQLAELQAIMAAVAASTPGGAVFFLPSFEYLATLAPRAGSRIGGRAVFVETRGAARGDGGDSILRAFAAAVQRDGGAVLLAVAGAKLSEGINFKDELCRLVVVVGLPYPNAGDLSLIEKMKFLDACRAQGAKGLSGREFYSARCSKGVNQCIGRSIRHAGDWAAVMLLDHRYAQAGINSAISLWLREQASQATFAEAETALREFFQRRADADMVRSARSGATVALSAAAAAAAGANAVRAAPAAVVV